MWVFCGGMFRSGSTVQYQITSHLVEHDGRGRRVPRYAPDEFDEARRAYAGTGGLLIFKSHGVSAPIRDELEIRGGRVITVHRDIRDVVASAIRKNDWTFRHIWKHGLLDRWTRRFDEWAGLPGALVSRYDTMIGALDVEATRIGRHLGVDVSPRLAAEIGAEYSFDRQRRRVLDVQARKERRELAAKYDDHSQLHYNHIASGEVGVFRDVLTPVEIHAVEDACGAWMNRWGYPPEAGRLGVVDRLRRAWLGRAAA